MVLGDFAMSMCVSAETVPFKVVVWLGDMDGGMTSTGVPQLDVFIEDLFGEDSEGDPVPGTVYGSWTVPDPTWERYGEVGANILKKGEKKVYAINEDKHNGFGGVTLTFFADDEDVLKEFMGDWNLLDRGDFSEIEKNRPVLHFC
jgi:hypothetical protein